MSRPFAAVEQLELRDLLSALPTVDAVEIAQGAVVAYQKFTVLVEAGDDVAVRGVSMYMDINDDARWDPLVDRPLGDRFQRNPQGKFEFNFIPDASWPQWVRIYADAVDDEGQWSQGIRGQLIVPVAMPLITMLSAHAAPNTIIPEIQPMLLRAFVSDPFRGSSTVEGVTFFDDLNGNGRWDAGVDTDLGYSQTIDADGAWTLTTYQWGAFNVGKSIAAAAKIGDPRFDFTNGFGPVRVTPFNPYFEAPVVRNIFAENLSGRLGPADGSIFQVGDRVRITADVMGQSDLQAATLFYDSNSNGRWDLGTDIDLGAFRFAPDVYGGRARFDFTITPDMNFDFRAFVIAARYKGTERVWDRGDYNWGATSTHWLNIVSPAWLESIQVQPRDVQTEPIYVTFNARDDHSITRFFAFVDLNDNDQLDAGEFSTNLATRISGNFTNGGWVMAIDVSGVSPPGTYKLKLYANDFDNGSGRTYSVNITL